MDEMSNSVLDDMTGWLEKAEVSIPSNLEALDDLQEALEELMNRWWMTMDPGIDPVSEPDTIGDLMTWAEWCDAVYQGAFIDYDGHGHAADAAGRTGTWGYLKPSMVADHITEEGTPPPSKITHVMWYNK